MKLLIEPSYPWRIIYVPVAERNGGLFPLLVLKNGLPSATAAVWARSLDREGWGDSKIEHHLRALAAFYSFCIAMKGDTPLGGHDLHQLVCDFADARFRGTVAPDGTDPVGLYWKRVLPSSIQNELRALNRYSDFVHRQLSLPPINPEEDRIVEVARYYSAARSAGRSDAMLHLKSLRRKPRVRRFSTNARRGGQEVARGRPKYLSPTQAIELVELGCRNPRDKMLVLLMAYAGMRVSEPLHLYVGDVTQMFPGTRAAKVRLEHPSFGLVHEAHDSGSALRRSEFLANRYARLPRNELGRGHREYSGWKGMTLSESDPAYRYAIWIEEAIVGAYFRSLLEQYLEDHKRVLLSGRMCHPYLFFNIRKRDPTNYGLPLSLSNAHETFEAAAKRARISCAPHSCRHHYGFYAADIIGVNQESLMRMLRHGSIVSTDTYFHISSATIRRNISDVPVERTGYSRPSFPSSWV